MNNLKMNQYNFMKKIILLFVISSVAVFSQSAGKTGLSFLKYGFGARNIAMGDAGTALSNDLTGLFYNPAVSIHQWIRSIIYAQ